MNASQTITPDYSLVMEDSAGRTVTLHISGASIDAAVVDGQEYCDAREDAESNQFSNAIARNEIGADAWLVSRN